jgi:hypothetical protein
MKKLYKCKTTIEVFMVSENEPPAYEIEDAIQEEISNNGLMQAVYCKEVKELELVPKSWLGAIPYGSEDDKTVSEIFKEKL